MLIFLPTDRKKLLLQWKGSHDVTKIVGPNDYKVLMTGKEKTLYANLLKKYVVREDYPVGNAVPAVQADHQQNIPSCVTVVEYCKPYANIPGTEDPPADSLSAGDLPEISAWGPKVSIADLKFRDWMSTEQVQELRTLTS